MPIGNWWTVNDSLMRITGGPYLWDGSAAWSPPSGERAINTDPTAQGYAWPATADPPTLSSLAARVTALEARLTTEARGVKAVPNVTLILGGTTTVRVTLKTAMPNTNYTPSAFLVGGAQIGNLTVQSATVVDRQNVDVVLKAGLALTISGVSVLVFADAN